MAISRVKVWISEVLTASDLNAEYNNIINYLNGSGVTLSSPTLSGTVAGAADYVGTATNNDAAAGSKGEYKETQVDFASPVSLTSGVDANVATLALTAGDWIVGAHLRTVPNAATTTSQIIACVGTTSATLHDIGNTNRLPVVRSDIAITAGGIAIFPLGIGRLSIAAPTTVYFIARVTFAVNTMGASGIISAWRVR